MNKSTLHSYWLLTLLLSLTSWLFASVPAGYYYPARNKMKAGLKTALHSTGSPLQVYRYGSGEGATWQGFFFTDQNSDGSVFDRYSAIKRYFDGYSSISDMHIEHSLPKSWWGGADNMAYRDLFHLYPSDGRTNSYKNNYPLGIVEEATANYANGVSKIGKNTFGSFYTGLAFEPADEFKGDFARSYLYISTIYEHFAPLWVSPMMQQNTYPVWTPWAIDLLMQWHESDPVSELELQRQEAVYAIQGNRNPFIDYPDLASYIWGPDTLSTFPFPEETGSFLFLPRRGYVLDFDLILQGDTLGRSLDVQGLNLSGTIAIRLKNEHPAFSLNQQSLTADEVLDGTDVRIVFRPQASGTFRDTLLIEGGGLTESFLVPLEGKASRQLMALEPEVLTPVGATLHWIADPKAETYEIKVYKGATRAGNLLISSYVEGSSYNKAIEIYNGTGATIQLSDYMVAKQSNGTGDYESVYRLSGNLADGQSVVVVHQLCTNEDLKAKATFFTDSVMNFNGNDALALLHNNLRVDAVGYFDAGADQMWGENKTLYRSAAVTHPSQEYREADWQSLETDDFSPLGNHRMTFSSQQILVADISIAADRSLYELTELEPETSYNYQVRAIRKDGAVQSVNSVQFFTASPEVPVPMEPTDIGSTYFLAEWDSDLYSEQFEVQAYYKIGAADVTEVVPFNEVGSSGKPLPSGWSGTASGNYTTATSSGVAPPSVALKTTGEWLQSPVYPYSIREISFMYRYPSNGTGSYFTVEALQGSEWVTIDRIDYVNTSKTILSYTFGPEDNVLSIRITYANKASGNLAIDDFRAVYGNEINEYLFQNRLVTGTTYRVENLSPTSSYYYRVRSVIGEVRSAWSEEVKVTTLLGSSLESEGVVLPRWTITSSGIVLMDLQPGSRVHLFSVTGQLLGDFAVNHPSLELSLKPSQVYIIRLVNSQSLYSFKVIR